MIQPASLIWAGLRLDQAKLIEGRLTGTYRVRGVMLTSRDRIAPPPIASAR